MILIIPKVYVTEVGKKLTPCDHESDFSNKSIFCIDSTKSKRCWLLRFVEAEGEIRGGGGFENGEESDENTI